MTETIIATITLTKVLLFMIDFLSRNQVREKGVNYYHFETPLVYSDYLHYIILPSICKQKTSKQKKRAPTSPQHLQYITKICACKPPILFLA